MKIQMMYISLHAKSTRTKDSILSYEKKNVSLASTEYMLAQIDIQT